MRPEPLFDAHPSTKPTWQGRANHARYNPLDCDIRSTDDSVFGVLDEEFGFTLDVAALPENAKCDDFYTPEDDGLVQPWAPERCWLNPPYSDIAPWTRKAVLEAEKGALVVGLLPVRTDLLWFHRDVLEADAQIRFVRGRLRFGNAQLQGRAKWVNVPFASMVVVWGAP